MIILDGDSSVDFRHLFIQLRSFSCPGVMKVCAKGDCTAMILVSVGGRYECSNTA